MTGGGKGKQPQTQMDLRWAELQRFDEQAQELHIMRGLTRGNLMILLRRKRKQACQSLRGMAEHLDCSHVMLHDLEEGRRWSDEIVRRYVAWFRGPTNV